MVRAFGREVDRFRMRRDPDQQRGIVVLGKPLPCTIPSGVWRLKHDHSTPQYGRNNTPRIGVEYPKPWHAATTQLR